MSVVYHFVRKVTISARPATGASAGSVTTRWDLRVFPVQRAQYWLPPKDRWVARCAGSLHLGQPRTGLGAHDHELIGTGGDISGYIDYMRRNVSFGSFA